ncbi:amino acid permease [Streptomyces sp. NPDC088707]|uniref:amino acid permease n=1 Tax=Streptomyces sp. NPDC088707 TaxID=3365871 RepID=UPI0038266537
MTTPHPDETDKGLRSGSVGLLASVALGLSSTAPAYSITVTLGYVALVVGDLAPAALLLGFVPILLTAFAFRELNREMPDCGTTFVWNTRAFGPRTGWFAGGWVPQIATLIAMAALAQVSSGYLLSFLGLGKEADDALIVAVVAVLILAVLTGVARRGLRLAAGLQYVLLGLQLLALISFGVAALARDGAQAPSLSWLDPFGIDGFGSFPETVRQLAWLGAEIIVQPTLTTTRDREMELVCARANAWTNQVYVVNVNASDPAGVGSSAIVDPEGIVRQQAGTGEEILVDVLDLDTVTRVREQGSAGLNRPWAQLARYGERIHLPMYGGAFRTPEWAEKRIPGQ